MIRSCAVTVMMLASISVGTPRVRSSSGSEMTSECATRASFDVPGWRIQNAITSAMSANSAANPNSKRVGGMRSAPPSQPTNIGPRPWPSAVATM